ncbi:MAG TPA: hypothetical protein VK486_06805 [Thermoleophilaceae bacterium]|nr:hypothetical protein [Thermoleophilaceae bacterium]
MPAVAIVAGTALLVVSWLCWTGRWRAWSRIAVLPSMPITLAPAVGLCLLLVGIGDLAEGARGAFYAPALLAATAGIVLVLWDPDWWGPRWFRERDREFDLSVPINAAVAATVRSDPGAASSEAVVRARLGQEPLARWRAHLVSGEHSRPSAMQRIGVVRGHLMLYPEAIAFAADVREDRMRGAPVVEIIPAGKVIAARRVSAGTGADGSAGPTPDLPSRVMPRLRVDTHDGPRVFETAGAGRRAEEIERRYLAGRQPAAAGA